LSKSRSLTTSRALETSRTSAVRTVLAAVLAVLGIAWVVYYDRFVVKDQTPKQVADLGNWNYLIGFGLLFVGLIVAAHPSTPLGRGRGVVVGMLGCFLIGLAWIVVYYVTSQSTGVPVISQLGNYNLMVGVGFMAVGFVYATRWE
jgi:Cell division protein CrgA